MNEKASRSSVPIIDESITAAATHHGIIKVGLNNLFDALPSANDLLAPASKEEEKDYFSAVKMKKAHGFFRRSGGAVDSNTVVYESDDDSEEGKGELQLDGQILRPEWKSCKVSASAACFFFFERCEPHATTLVKRQGLFQTAIAAAAAAAAAATHLHNNKRPF